MVRVEITKRSFFVHPIFQAQVQSRYNPGASIVGHSQTVSRSNYSGLLGRGDLDFILKSKKPIPIQLIVWH